MSDNTNMALWSKVCAIDPKYTKKAKVSGMEITSFSLQSVVMMATEQFGMFGKGWGYEVEMERFDQGSVIVQASTYEDQQGKMIHTNEIKEVTHTLTIRFWYVSDGEKVICPIQAGHTPYIMATQYGPKHDQEYYKKTLADAIKKSLSMLGFGADIFLGLNDDQTYVELMNEERKLKENAALPERINAFDDRVEQMCNLFSANDKIHSVTAMKDNFKLEINKTCRQLGINPVEYIERLKNAFEARIQELNKQEK